MINKLLKIELYLLFFLAFVTCFYFFFGESLPDNSLEISSISNSYFGSIYYFSSFFALISYYVGPWICLPFITYSFAYSFILSRRSKESDPFLFFVILIFYYFLTYLLFPRFLGDGLGFLSHLGLNTYISFFSCLIFAFLMFYLILGNSFFIISKKLFLLMNNLGLKVFNNTGKLTSNTKSRLLDYKNAVSTFDVKDRARKAILDQSLKPRSKNKSPEEITADHITELTPLVSISDDKPVMANKSVGDGIVPEPKSDNTIKEINKNIDSVSLTNQSRFFKTEDLIKCINVNVENSKIKSPDDSYFQSIIDTIESKLAEFKLDGKIINILKGPVVDTFELELGAGVKVSKVTGLSDDIGLALNGAPIRIVYPMRGKSTIGVEVPRNPREFILLDEVLQSDYFNDSKLRLPIAMGKDAFGDVKVVDLAGMPHMLVAGATGAGKSVFINTLLVSLIVKKSPRQLKLILIDPKQLELALFQDLPHLMLPVITDSKSSAVALLWAVQEMEQRYTILKEMGVKNIEGFNKKIKTCDPSILLKINHYYEDREDEGYELPYIVVVIDEFADLILSKSGKEIELNVNRLAAKARAAGIHLVVATQRPSTDVVTGVVKANFPTRVAFKVSTGHDSKTILDQYGAQKLLGKGDMLYKQGVDLLRVHSSFVDEVEIEELIAKLATIPKTYSSQAIDFLENGGEGLEDEDELISGGSYVSGTSSDPMYQQALETVIESGSASASMLQRRLRVGYNRAANLVEELEKNGVVGPAQGSKPRKVISRSE